MTPLVSIMIPSYNQSASIERAVQSALAQDYTNLEVLVSDDASTDATPTLAQQFLRDARFRFFQSPSNRGRVANYRTALYQYARGEFVLNLDADDYLIDPTYIRRAIDIIESNKDVVAVFAKKKIFVEKLDAFVSDNMQHDLPEVVSGNWLFLHFYKGYTISHLTTLYNRKEAMAVGYYRADILSSDWESVLRLIINHHVGWINATVGVWTLHKTNASRPRNIGEIIRGIAYIESPYTFAQSSGAFSQEALMIWRSKMRKRYLLKNLVKLFLLQRSLVVPFLQAIYRYDAALFYSMVRDVRFLGLLACGWNRSVLRMLLKWQPTIRSFASYS